MAKAKKKAKKKKTTKKTEKKTAAAAPAAAAQAEDGKKVFALAALMRRQKVRKGVLKDRKLTGTKIPGILDDIVRPLIVMIYSDAGGDITYAELHRKFKQLTNSSVSPQKFREWLKELGIEIKVESVVRGLPSLSTDAGSDDEDEGEDDAGDEEEEEEEGEDEEEEEEVDDEEGEEASDGDELDELEED